MRKRNLILCVFTLLLSNSVYFIWMPYPKSFLKTVGSSTFLFDCVTNLVFFTAFAVVLLVSVNAVTKPGSILTKSKIPAAIAICIAVQFGFDFLKFAAERLLRWWAPLSNDFFTVLLLFILVLVTCKLLKVENIRWKRFFAVFLPTAIIILAVFFVLDVRDILYVQHASEKYVFYLFDTELTHEMNAIAANTQFLYEIRNALLDFLTCSVIMISLYFSTASENIEDNEEYHTKEAHFVTRIAAILLLSSLICGLKFLVLPQNFLTTIHMQNSASHSIEPSFDYNRTFIAISRATGYHKKKEIYRKTHGTLYYDDKKMLDIYMDYEFKGNPIEVLTVNGRKIRIICKNQAIAYLKDEKPYVASFQDINKQGNDVILIEVCKELLSEGRLDCFEYICAYVMQYDPGFIKPYLERYCIGDFSNIELQKMGDIDPDYIAKCAKQFVD